jgi:hypothetical protein
MITTGAVSISIITDLTTIMLLLLGDREKVCGCMEHDRQDMKVDSKM